MVLWRKYVLNLQQGRECMVSAVYNVARNLGHLFLNRAIILKCKLRYRFLIIVKRNAYFSK